MKRPRKVLVGTVATLLTTISLLEIERRHVLKEREKGMQFNTISDSLP
jgi:hypothetical protein